MAEGAPGADGLEGMVVAAIARGLAEAGTRTLFGLPGGGSNLALIGECERAGLDFVLTHGETAAAIMAAAYGEMTGAPGACVVTRGPGAASAVNGVAQALLDRAPMLIVTDAVPTSEAQRVSHQRLDQHALLRPVTKWSVSVGPENAGDVIRTAVRVACEPPAGPVHISVDADGVGSPRPPDPVRPRRTDLDRARRLVAGSSAPVVALGVGARRATREIRRACDRLGCPVLATYKAKGVLPDSSPSLAGLLTGATIESGVLRRADLIVAVGLDPVELIPAPWPYAAPILSLAEWTADSDYFVPAAEVVGPLGPALELLGPLASIGCRQDDATQPLRQVLELPGEGLQPAAVVKAARELLPRRTVATIDSGAHMFPAMACWSVEEPDEVAISSGLATMGFALPAAVAAARARPGRPVVCLTGDGGLGMTLAELETLGRYGLPVVVLVLNDSALSLIEVKQRDGQGGHNAVAYSDVDFAAVACGLGLGARRVATLEGLRRALVEAVEREGPFLIDAVVDAGGYGAVLEAIRGGTR